MVLGGSLVCMQWTPAQLHALVCPRLATCLTMHRQPASTVAREAVAVCLLAALAPNACHLRSLIQPVVFACRSRRPSTAKGAEVGHWQHLCLHQQGVSPGSVAASRLRTCCNVVLPDEVLFVF